MVDTGVQKGNQGYSPLPPFFPICTILRAKRESWNERISKLEESGNTAGFWRDVKGMINGPREIVLPLFVDADGNQISEPEEQAAMLLDEYCPAHTVTAEVDAVEDELIA